MPRKSRHELEAQLQEQLTKAGAAEYRATRAFSALRYAGLADAIVIREVQVHGVVEITESVNIDKLDAILAERKAAAEKDRKAQLQTAVETSRQKGYSQARRETLELVLEALQVEGYSAFLYPNMIELLSAKDIDGRAYNVDRFHADLTTARDSLREEKAAADRKAAVDRLRRNVHPAPRVTPGFDPADIRRSQSATFFVDARDIGDINAPTVAELNKAAKKEAARSARIHEGETVIAGKDLAGVIAEELALRLKDVGIKLPHNHEVVTGSIITEAEAQAAARSTAKPKKRAGKNVERGRE